MSTYTTIGDVGMEEVPGSKLTLKRGTAGKLTRAFEGDAINVPNFLLSHPIWGVTDYEFTSMVLDEIDVDYNGPTAKINCTYWGIPVVPGFNPNNLQQDAKFETRSVQLDTTSTADGEWIVNYYSPIITYRYTSSATLKDPLYQGFSQDPSNITIMDYHVAPPFTQPAGYTLAGTFRYNVYSVCTQFTRNQKGNIFNYAETWSVLLQHFTKPATNCPLGSIQDPVLN